MTEETKASVAALLEKISTPYERKARLYPAFLALLPILGIAASLYGFELRAQESLVSLASAIGGFYLLANIVREAGKRLEGTLFAKWGGTPTTQLQRHRDDRIDPVTKASRHLFLGKKLGAAFPKAADEAKDPKGADDLYGAGTRWLLEHTRDHEKFALIFAENISYGFRRNGLGLKPDRHRNMLGLHRMGVVFCWRRNCRWLLRSSIATRARVGAVGTRAAYHNAACLDFLLFRAISKNRRVCLRGHAASSVLLK